MLIVVSPTIFLTFISNSFLFSTINLIHSYADNITLYLSTIYLRSLSSDSLVNALSLIKQESAGGHHLWGG